MGTLIERCVGSGVCSVLLYNGQQFEQPPSRSVRPRRLHSRYLPSDVIHGTRDGPALLLAANQKWALMPLIASQSEQFEVPQLGTAALELEIFHWHRCTRSQNSMRAQ